MVTTTVSQFDISQLRKAVAAALSLPEERVISGFLPENRFDGFITVDKLSTSEIGQSKRYFDGVNEIERIESSFLSKIAISAYGNNAYALTVKLRNLLQGSLLIDKLRAMNAYIVQFSDVRNLTAIVGAEWHERGQFELTLSHKLIVETPLNRIELASVTGSVQTEIDPPFKI